MYGEPRQIGVVIAINPFVYFVKMTFLAKELHCRVLFKITVNVLKTVVIWLQYNPSIDSSVCQQLITFPKYCHGKFLFRGEV